MEPLTPAVFIITAIIGATAVLSFLHLLATATGHETALQKLRIEVIEARNRYIRHVRGDGESDVIIVDEADADT